MVGASRALENTRFVECARAPRVRSVAAMTPGARTPEELETLFEDAFVVGDGAAVAALFEDEAVLVTGPGEARGTDAIASVAARLCRGGAAPYLAAPRHVLAARDTALVVGPHGASVVRRGSDATWRYAIALLALENGSDTTTRQEQT
jgi:hypothetical protein